MGEMGWKIYDGRASFIIVMTSVSISRVESRNCRRGNIWGIVYKGACIL